MRAVGGFGCGDDTTSSGGAERRRRRRLHRRDSASALRRQQRLCVRRALLAGPTAQFFLDGDFDMLVDYDLVSPPPGETHLVLSVRNPGASRG